MKYMIPFVLLFSTVSHASYLCKVQDSSGNSADYSLDVSFPAFDGAPVEAVLMEEVDKHPLYCRGPNQTDESKKILFEVEEGTLYGASPASCFFRIGKNLKGEYTVTYYGPGIDLSGAKVIHYDVICKVKR